MGIHSNATTTPVEQAPIGGIAAATGLADRTSGQVSQKLNPLSLRKNFSWTFLGNVVYAGSQWAMLVLLAKLGTPETVGKIALGLAVTAPVILFANLQLRSVQATDAKAEYEFRHYLGLRLVTTVLALVAIAVITLTSGYARETAVVVMIIGVAKAFEALSDVVYGLVQQHERMDRIAKAMIIKGPLSLVMLAIGVLVGGIVGGVIGLAVAWALVLVTYDIRSSARILRSSLDDSADAASRVVEMMKPRFDRAVLLKLTWLALPLGFAAMLISLNTNIPRYFIERHFGEWELGIFAAMAYLMVAGTTIIMALAQSASPRLAKYYASQDRAAFLYLFVRLLGVGTVLGLAGVLAAQIAGKWVLELLYQPEYAEHNDVFVLIAFAAALGYMSTFAGIGMTATRQFRIQTVLFGLIAGITALASLALIPSHGLRGAAFVLIISNAVQLVTSLFVVLYALHAQAPQQEEQDQDTATPQSKTAEDNQRPIRVLHVLGAMNRGGVEAWLISVLRNIDHDRFQMDFLVHTTEPAAYDEEIRALGSEIFPCMHPQKPLLYARNFRKIMDEHGPYDVVHSHVHHYSGWVLMHAARAGVPVRLAHSHNGARNSHLDKPSDLVRRAYMSATEWLVRRYATHGLASSVPAAEALFGQNWKDDPRFEVQHNTSDVSPFNVGQGDEATRKSLRAELGLPDDAFVMGHVGRFFPPKNHDFLIDVAAEVFKRAPDARLLMVGDGELRPEIEAKVARLGIADQVVFAGVRSDVPSIMLNVIDIFVFTSISEGLGIAMVEAQAAGLPCVYTDAVPHEADLVPPLLKRLSITESPTLWADAILAKRNIPRPVTQAEALAEVKKSTFNIEANLRDLGKIYQCAR
jgi:O-antigen/teichoic acid export membrane protein/glycosyltransferase involved in cell wall biosynthesis